MQNDIETDTQVQETQDNQGKSLHDSANIVIDIAAQITNRFGVNDFSQALLTMVFWAYDRNIHS